MRFWKRFSRRAASPSSQDLLSSWLPGREAIVCEIAGSSRFVTRLRELGILPGEPIRVLRGGNSLIVQVGEGRFGLRRRDAAAILVRSPEHRPPSFLATS
jgi:Fe2+ transport system protein FeoA